MNDKTFPAGAEVTVVEGSYDRDQGRYDFTNPGEGWRVWSCGVAGTGEDAYPMVFYVRDTANTEISQKVAELAIQFAYEQGERDKGITYQGRPEFYLKKARLALARSHSEG